MRPTKSLGLYIQMGGRVLRTYDGKKWAYILDHARCKAMHGDITDDRDWQLTKSPAIPEKKRTRGASGARRKQCTECFLTHEPAPVCPHCGFKYEANRVPVIYDGELKLDAAGEELLRKLIMESVDKARSLTDLLMIETEYKKHAGWAKNIYAERNKSQLNL